jgi:hypothetical protein
VRQQPTNETPGLRPEDDAQPPYLYSDYVATQLRAPEVVLERWFTPAFRKSLPATARCWGARKGL